MQEFKKVTDPNNFKWSWKMGSLEIDYLDLVDKIWEPFKYTENNFPDDKNKVQVCWGFNKQNEAEQNINIAIWDYKSYADDLAEIKQFSFYAPTDRHLQEFLKQYDLENYLVENYLI